MYCLYFNKFISLFFGSNEVAIILLELNLRRTGLISIVKP